MHGKQNMSLSMQDVSAAESEILVRMHKIL